MNTINSLKEEMVRLLPSIDSHVFSPEVYAKTGVFVVRNVVDKKTVGRWLAEYRRLEASFGGGGRHLTKNPVEFMDLKDGLNGIWRHPGILKVVSQVFGPNVGIFNRRFVIKDRNYHGKIFLHQDTGYQIGTVEKASAFIAVSEAGPHNGGLTVYPGTLRFGFLGDAGEINREILPEDWPGVCPKLESGDMLLMHSMTWHESGEFVDGPDRILTDFIYQEANDPSTTEVVQGDGGWSENFLTSKRGDDFQVSLFQRSRKTTIKELSEKLEAV